MAESVWECEEHDVRASWTFSDVADAGTPVCEECGDDMELKSYDEADVSIWECEEDNEKVSVTYGDIEYSGSPICGECGHDMELLTSP